MLMKAWELGTPKAREPLKVAGRLVYFINLEGVDRGTWVLQTIAGYQIDLYPNFQSTCMVDSLLDYL